MYFFLLFTDPTTTINNVPPFPSYIYSFLLSSSLLFPSFPSGRRGFLKPADETPEEAAV